ncbi:chromate transporter [Viridibacterium curvum]|uniref:Chromate transporter n=1 Tax=Viridibacterium curvum TaxID=1101404 RepID=A0ABP9QHD9_9RHOO
MQAHSPSKLALFTGFLQCGLAGFGGVLPHARSMLVDDRKWLTEDEFADLLGLGQCLPGPNICNVAVVVGQRFHGATGAILASLGLLGAPFFIVLSLALLYERWADSALLTAILQAVAAGAAGLVLATGIRLLSRLKRRAEVLLIALMGLTGVVWLKLPLVIVLLLLAPIGIGVGWYATRGKT